MSTSVASNMAGPGEEEAVSSSRARRRGRRTSKVWEFYDLSGAAAGSGTGGQDRAICRTCFQELSATGSNGTSHLLRHGCYNKWIARKKLLFDPVTHQRRTDLNLLAAAGFTNVLSGASLAAAAGGHGHRCWSGRHRSTRRRRVCYLWDINALRLQPDAARYQLLEGLIRVLTAPAAPTVDPITLLAETSGGAAVSGHHFAAGVDHHSTTTASRAVQQYDGMLSLPALTSVPAVTQDMWSSMSSAYSLSGLLNGFGSGAGMTTNALAGDGLSFREHGHSGATTGSNITVAAAMPPPLAPAAEGGNASNGVRTSSTPSPWEETPASSPFDGLDSLTLDFHTSSDSWSELLEQMSWLNNPNDQL